MIATMMGAEALIILSNIDGIYDGNPNDPSSRIIPEISAETRTELSKYIQSGKSSFGRGGMLTKCNIARKVAQEGIEVIIANGKRDADSPTCYATKDVGCTRFLPGKKDDIEYQEMDCALRRLCQRRITHQCRSR